MKSDTKKQANVIRRHPIHSVGKIVVCPLHDIVSNSGLVYFLDSQTHNRLIKVTFIKGNNPVSAIANRWIEIDGYVEIRNNRENIQINRIKELMNSSGEDEGLLKQAV